MLKCFKLPVIQVSTGFEGFLLGSLRCQNRVVSRSKNSIFTIVKIAKMDGKSTKKNNIHIGGLNVDKSQWQKKEDYNNGTIRNSGVGTNVSCPNDNGGT